VTAFGAYARYYDLLYRDKDYRGETEFVEYLIQRHVPDARQILELGCGTGGHAQVLAEHGYRVAGLDQSEDMLLSASQRIASLPKEIAERMRFFKADARDFRTDGKYDAVISLFHVMSYQITNDDLRAVFANVKYHLAPHGVFIFDCWYGPAVLSDPPVIREKRFEDEATRITRIAEPTLHSDRNVVDVNFRISVNDKASNVTEALSELHHMRYLFKPEVDMLAEDSGFEIASWGTWMSDSAPDISTWYAWFAVKVCA